MVRYRWNRPRRKPTPSLECQDALELQTEQTTLIEDEVTLSLSHKLKVAVGRHRSSHTTSSIGTQTDPELAPESRRPRLPSAQRSPPMIRTQCFRALLPAPVPLYPIALGLPPSQTEKHRAEKTEAETSNSATSVYTVPMESVVCSVSEKHSSCIRDAVDAEIVDILRSPTNVDRSEMLSMYDQLVHATQDGRSCYMSSSESRCPFFIGDVPFGYKCPESMRKLKQASTRGKILSWLLRGPVRKVSN